MKIEITGDKVSLDITGTYTAEELSKLIQQIGSARGQIAQDPPTPEGVEMEAVLRPSWYTEFNALVGMHQLCFLNNLGWQAFLLPPQDGASLIHFLAAQLRQLCDVKDAIAAAEAAHSNSGNPNDGPGSGLVH